MTEACHFLPASERAGWLRLVAAGMLRVIDVLPDTMRIVVLLEKYRDRVRELADVSLIYLAEGTWRTRHESEWDTVTRAARRIGCNVSRERVGAERSAATNP